MRRPLSIVLKIPLPLLVVVVLAIGWRFWPDQQGRIVPIGEKIDMGVLRRFTATLAKAKQIVVFEGLPHQSRERLEQESERRLKKCVQIHGYFFYDDLRLAANEEFASLRQALLRSGGIIQLGGRKKCGGFHPDYLVRWTGTDGTYDALVCFGCHEIKLIGPGKRLYADLSKETYEELKQTLASFRKHRPTTE